MQAQKQATAASHTERRLSHELVLQQLKSAVGWRDDLSGRAVERQRQQEGRGSVWWQGMSVQRAEQIFDNNLFMGEAHVTAFAHRLQREIVAIDDRRSGRAGSFPMIITHYRPSFVAWSEISLTQAKLMRKAEKPPIWLVMEPDHWIAALPKPSALEAVEL